MKTYLEPKEIDEMEQKTSNLRDRLLVRLLYHLGCRISEALALKVDDIDFTTRHCYYQAPKKSIEAVLHRVWTKTWQKSRLLPQVRW